MRTGYIFDSSRQRDFPMLEVFTLKFYCSIVTPHNLSGGFTLREQAGD